MNDTIIFVFFFFKQKTAYEMRISDWSSDVCSSDLSYKVSDYYAPECDGGVHWNCPQIGIDWPLPASGPILSDKDQNLPVLADFKSPFAYDGRPLVGLGEGR